MGAGPGREIEFKLLLGSERELEALKRAALAGTGAASRTVAQVNHFFDTPVWDLRRAEHALRLRRAGETCTITAKGPSTGGAAGASVERPVERPEEETRITDGEADAILAGSSSPLDVLESALGRASELCASMRRMIGDRPLQRRGSFENLRTVIAPFRITVSGAAVELELELDRTELPGGELHYELELEVREEQVEAGRQALEALLGEVGIEWRPARSKVERFFEALARQGGRSGPCPG